MPGKEADARRVGLYLIMPNHIHLFCSPANEDHTIESWITLLKRRFRHATPQIARDFNRAAFTIGFGATRTITRN